MTVPEIDASDMKYVEVTEVERGVCLVRMRNNVEDAYNLNYRSFSGNPKRLESPCASIKCYNCAFNKDNTAIKEIYKYLPKGAYNNVCYEDDLIMIL